MLKHKLSRDHVENSGFIRGRGGYNNPIATQSTAYKRLLVRTEVTSSSSRNCSKHIVSILNTNAVAQVEAASTLTDMRRFSILDTHDHNYTHPESLSAVVAVVAYIAGFIVQQVCKTTSEECIGAWCSDERAPLVEQKNRGGLMSLSKDVIGWYETIEKRAAKVTD